MAGKIGLWIDHGKAVLVKLNKNGKGEERIKLVSDVEPKTRYHGGSRPPKNVGGFETAAENKAEHRRENQLKAWYREVESALLGAGGDLIVIMGPGMAKTEFMGEVEKNKPLAQKIVGVESTDKMTENQIAAAVREYFKPYSEDTVPAYRRAPGT